MPFPLVSIVIPVYNQRPEFLRECIAGAVNQTYENIEVIISDNHCTDNCMEVLSGFSSSRIKVVKPAQHMEIADHFNFAADQARGEYISILSSDDLIFPDCIAKVVQPLLDNPSLSFSYCENAIINEKGEQTSVIRSHKLPDGIYSKKKIARRMYELSEYWIIGAVMPRVHFNKLRFAKGIRAADWILGFQLLQFGDVAYRNELLSAIRFHDRQEGAKQQYAEAHVLHNIQRADRHQYIIDDAKLLDAIGMTKGEAIAYRNKEITGATITLVRQFHRKEVSAETVEKIMTEYKKIGSGGSFRYLSKRYASKAALAYTYLMGIAGRIRRIFSPGY